MRRPDPLRIVLRQAAEAGVSDLVTHAHGGIVSVTSWEARFDPALRPLAGALTQLCLNGRFWEHAGKAHVRSLSGGWPGVPLGGADDVRAMVGAHVLASLLGRPVRVSDAPMGARVPIEAVGFRATPDQPTRWVEIDLDGGHELPAAQIVARLAKALGVPVASFQVTTSSPRGLLEGRYRVRALLERYRTVAEAEGLMRAALHRAGLGEPKQGVLELYPSSNNTRLPFGWGGCTVVYVDERGVEASRAALLPGQAMADLGDRPSLPVSTPGKPQALRRLGDPPERELRAPPAPKAAREIRIRPRDSGPSPEVRAFIDSGCGVGRSDEAARILAQDLRRRHATLDSAIEELERIASEVGAGSRAEARGRFFSLAVRTLRRWWEKAEWRGGSLVLGEVPLSHVMWAVQRSLFTRDPGRALRLALYGLGWIHAHDGTELGPQIAWNLWEAANGGGADYARLRAELDMFAIVEQELTPDEAAQRSLREGQTVEPYSRRWALVADAPDPWRDDRWIEPHRDPWGSLAAVVEASPHINGAALRACVVALGLRQVDLAARCGRSQKSISRALHSSTAALPSWLRVGLTTNPGQESTPPLGWEGSERVRARERVELRDFGRASRDSDEGVFPPKIPSSYVGRGSARVLKKALSPPAHGPWSTDLSSDRAEAASVVAGGRPCAQVTPPSLAELSSRWLEAPSRVAAFASGSSHRIGVALPATGAASLAGEGLPRGPGRVREPPVVLRAVSPLAPSYVRLGARRASHAAQAPSGRPPGPSSARGPPLDR